MIISTDLSHESINILDMESKLKSFLPQFQEKNHETSFELIERIILNHQLSKEKINKLKTDYNFEENSKEFLNSTNFIDKILSSEKFLEKYNFNIEKPKSLIIVFGNESRGISELVRKNSDYKIIIPHFGHSDVSYNISVCCGMVLFNLYSYNLLPGSFLDHNKAEGLDIILRNLINSMNNNHSKIIQKLRFSDVLEDF